MDLNYDISLMPFSLTSICAVKVTSQMLSALHTKMEPWRSSYAYKSSCAAAEENVAKLKLPSKLQELLVKHMKPVSDQVRIWHDFVSCRSVPVWTPQGTISNIACIEEIIAQEDARVPHSEAPRHTWDKVSAIALRGNHDLACQHVHPRVWPCDTVLLTVCKFDDPKVFFNASCPELDLVKDFSPATVCLMFRNQSDEDQRMSRIFFATVLLNTLVSWPHQLKLLDATRSLTSPLYSKCYWQILGRIAGKMADGYKDYDYLELFIGFWRLSTVQRSSRPIGECACFSLMFNVLMTKDQRLIDFVFSELSDGDKTSLLIVVDRNHFCYRLVDAQEFEMFERFVSFCGMHSPVAEVQN